MIVQAVNDDLTTIPKSTSEMIHNFCANGSDSIGLRTYIEQDLQGVLLVSLNNAWIFVDSVSAGRAVPSDVYY